MGQTADQFVRSVRRRWVMHRIVDAALLSAAVVSAVSLAALLFRNLELLRLLEAISTAVVIGIAVAVMRLPKPVSVLCEIDAQLNTHDLLTTAVRGAASDPAFTAILKSQADAFCARHDPYEVMVRHRSVGTRVAIVLLIAITLNVAWLRRSTLRNDVAAASRSIASAGLVDAMMPATKAQLASTGHKDDMASHEESSAAERTFTQASGGARQPGHRGDANGSAVAVTNDAKAQLLPAVVGGDASEHADGGERGKLLAKDHGLTAAVPSGDVIGSANSIKPSGVTSAEAPAEYRDLIRAYFSKSSH